MNSLGKGKARANAQRWEVYNGNSFYLCNICLFHGAGAVVPVLVTSAPLTPTGRAWNIIDTQFMFVNDWRN